MGNKHKTRANARNVNLEKQLIVSSWNINRGLLKKQTEIEKYLQDHKVDILAMQETDLSFYSEKNPFVIPGYMTFANGRNSANNKTRLLVLAKNDLRISVRNDLMNENFCSVWLEVQAKKKFIVVQKQYISF